MAGLCRTTTSTAAAEDRDETESQDRSVGRCRVLHPSRRARCSATATTAAVTTKAASAASQVWARNWPPVEVEVTDDDQVGQVGAGQEQRAGVGEKETSVEQGRLALPRLRAV